MVIHLNIPFITKEIFVQKNAYYDSSKERQTFVRILEKLNYNCSNKGIDCKSQDNVRVSGRKIHIISFIYV